MDYFAQVLQWFIYENLSMPAHKLPNMQVQQAEKGQDVLLAIITGVLNSK